MFTRYKSKGAKSANKVEDKSFYNFNSFGAKPNKTELQKPQPIENKSDSKKPKRVSSNMFDDI